jgi:N-acetylmuramoyl-L-alanine amidase CwlA
MVKVRQNLVSSNLYNWKSPYSMKPTRIVVHNTANDASADQEIRYMNKSAAEGGRQVSYHYAVDDIEAVQGLPENRNGWHAGDGGNGKGNREGIAIEICYSKSGGERFIKAEQNAVELIADILKRYGWGIDKVTKHQDYSGKYCPHRTLDMGWDRFINMIKENLSETSKPIVTPPTTNNSVFLYANYNGTSIVDALKSIGVDSSFSNRTKLANINSISDYKGTSEQNTTLLNLLKQGKLRANDSGNTNASSNTNSNNTSYLKANYNGGSIVDALKSVGVNSSYSYRSKLAAANGISNYKGTSEQNTTLLNLLKQGKLIKV